MEHPLVSMVNGTPTTSSQLVAQTFGKEHKNVLRDIEKILPQLPEKFRLLNFELANYLDSQGISRPMYLLTRDAFTLLVMGYTGKEAMQFKVKYIEAFNAMEEELRKQEKPRAKKKPKALPAPTSPEAMRHPTDGGLLFLDLTSHEPISFPDLVIALNSLACRFERTCHNFTTPEYEAGLRRFHKAAGNDVRLDCMISALLVGPKFTTLTMLQSVRNMAEKAERMNRLVCGIE